MAIKQIKLDINEVTIGMFISKLDRPWTQTPFPLQGFYIRNIEEIKQLKSHCKHVYIDVIKGRSPFSNRLNALSDKPKQNVLSRSAKNTPANVNVAPLKIHRGVYREQEPLIKEVKKAQQLHQKVYLAVGEVLKQLECNDNVPVQETKRLASEMVDSVLRNPDAFTWLSRVREKDEHTYSHAVRSAVWALLFGRHIGLPKKQLDTLALGVLLKDIGKARLNLELIVNEARTPPQQKEYENFIDYGVEILRLTPGIEPRVIAVVKTHCERLNGSGFPKHLKGDKIPLLGKIAGIVTFYDEVTNPRGENYPLAPSKAVARLYELRNTEFQEELVVEFIRAIGLYPTGTLVELSTGEVGVVVEQNFERRLKPKVLLVLDAFKHYMSKPLLLDLAEDERRKQKTIDAGRMHPGAIERIEIARDLEPGSYDIDISQVRDEYLFKKNKKGLFSLLGLK